MDDQAPTENPAKGFNKLDLTQLQSFSFGTQWVQEKSAPHEQRRDDRPRREGGGDRDMRRDGPSSYAGEVKKDRRAFRKPAGPETGNNAGAPPANTGAARPEGQGQGGNFRGAPRREFSNGPRRDGPGGDRGDFRGPRFDAPQDKGQYFSPFFNVTFYPEDIGFTALSKAVRTSCRTYELFEIARVIIGKNDRFVAVVQRKPSENSSAASEKPAPFGISMPDGLPFESEDAAINHVLSNHLGQFFDSAEVQIDPPKGSFQVINKCGITGDLLGAPNYHRYNQIIQQHHAVKVARMSFDAFRSRIETVRDPEVVNQWLEQMKKVTRYTWKNAPEGTPAATFDSIDEARAYLLATARDKVVKLVETVRFHGKSLELIPASELRRAIESTLERQRRFPLDTANALRGRLRRESFTIFKKGSKGVSYVCAVKRKFRIPGQTFSDSIGALISFIETNPMVKASELPVKFLGLHAPVPAAPVAPVVVEGTQPPIVIGGSIAPFIQGQAAALTPEDQAKLHRLGGDLRWLVTEGYVTEFIDGRLFAPPTMTEARKNEVEKDEHDPENFPEVPVAPVVVAAPAPVAEASAPAPVSVAEAPAPEAEAQSTPEATS